MLIIHSKSVQDYLDHPDLQYGPYFSISTFIKLFQPSIDCSLVNTYIFEMFECICLSFTLIKLIEFNNSSFKWLFTVAIHFKSPIFTTHRLTSFFFLQNRKFPKIAFFTPFMISPQPSEIQKPQIHQINLWNLSNMASR